MTGSRTGGVPEEYRRTLATLDCMTSRAAQGQDLDRGPLLTVAQAGEYLGTGERFIRRLIAERRIDYAKLGRHVRVQRSILDAFIYSGRIPRVPRTH